MHDLNILDVMLPDLNCSWLDQTHARLFNKQVFNKFYGGHVLKVEISKKNGQKKTVFHGKIEFRSGWRADSQLIGCWLVSSGCYLTFGTIILHLFCNYFAQIWTT